MKGGRGEDTSNVWVESPGSCRFCGFYSLISVFSPSPILSAPAVLSVNFLPFFFSSEPFQLLVSGFLLFSQYLFLPPLSSSSSLGLSSRQSRVPPTRLLFRSKQQQPTPLAPAPCPSHFHPTNSGPPWASSCLQLSAVLQVSSTQHTSLTLIVCVSAAASIADWAKKGKKENGGYRVRREEREGPLLLSFTNLHLLNVQVLSHSLCIVFM